MKAIGKVSIIFGAIFIISSVVASLFFFASFDVNEIKSSDHYTELNYEKSISYLGIDKVNLEFVSEEITIEKISGDNFVIKLNGYYPLSESGESPELIVEQNEGTLNSYVKYIPIKFFFGINSINSSLYVGVPENYNADLSLDSVSGNVEVSDLDLDQFEITLVSGNMLISNSKFSESEFDSVSGKITIDNSNSIDSLSSVSGRIEIIGYEISKDLDIETVSGDIKLDLLKGSSVEVNFDSVSGDLKNDFGTINDGDYKINVDSVSGYLSVY